MWTLYAKNYKMVMKEIKESLKKGFYYVYGLKYSI